MTNGAIRTGLTIAAAGSLLAGGAACSSEASGGHVSAGRLGVPNSPTYVPQSPSTERLGHLPPCLMAVKWLSADAIHLTLGKPTSVPGQIMDMNLTWGNGSGDAENAAITSTVTGNDVAAPITEQGAPIELGPERYDSSGDRKYTIQAQLDIGTSGAVLGCRRVIRIPHRQSHA